MNYIVVLSNGATLLIALIHIYILFLEMFFWTKPLGLRAFKMDEDFSKKTKTLAANQGLYNGFLAAGLIWSVLHPEASFAFQLKLFFLLCVMVAGVYGFVTVSKKILFVQALPALLVLVLLAFVGK